MAAEAGPNLGLTSHFGAGANGWDGAMDANLDMLDALVNIAVLSLTKTAPPANPAAGDRYIVAGGGTGAWAGKDNMLAVYRDGGWVYYAPKAGLRVFDLETAGFHFYAQAWAVEVAAGSGGGGGGLVDAPNDGKFYARQNGKWVAINVEAQPSTPSYGAEVAAQHWRIANLFNGQGTYLGTAELTFYDAAGNVIPSSNPFSNGSDTDPLVNVNDGDPNSYWTTNASDGSGYVGVDLGPGAKPHTFSLRPRPGALDTQSIHKGTVEYSTDGKQSWHVQRGFLCDYPWTGNGQVQTFSSLSDAQDQTLISARYWRIDNLLNGTSAAYVGTNELTFYDALGTIIPSFSAFSNNNDADPVFNVNDNDPRSFFTTRSVDGSGFAGVDFKCPVQPHSFSIGPRNGGYDYSIHQLGVSFSADKVGWTPVKQNLVTQPWTADSQVQTFQLQGS